MKKKLSLLLAILMLVSVAFGATSCNKDGEGEGGETTEATVVTTLAGDEDDAKLYEDLPTGDFGGYVFNILNGQSNYAKTTLVPVETQDSLNAAMFNRNKFVEQELNVKIVEDSRPHPAYKTIQEEVRLLNSSNDFAYDIIYNELGYQTALAQEGAYFATDEYEMYLDFSKPWWLTDAMDSIKIDGRTCELFGEFHLMFYESIWAAAFNQKIFTEKKMDFPYDLVRSGDWTIGAFKELAAQASAGDDGIYGVFTDGNYFSTAMIASTGFELISQDETDILIPYENDELLVSIYEALLPFYASNGDGMDNWIMPNGESDAKLNGSFTDNKEGQLFLRGRAAFFTDTIGAMQRIRAADFDYGIVPLPKYESGQETYVSNVFRAAASGGIPVTSPDVERTCTILENLTAYSYQMVKKEYYEVVVQARTVRDNDSIEMLDIIFGNSENGVVKFELDAVYGIGISSCINLNISDAAPEVKSQLDSIKGTSVKTNIDNVIKAYK